jgi:hypothetical protein
MELRYRSRISYKLNPFSYCRVLNDRVRAESLVPSFGMVNDYHGQAIRLEGTNEEKVPNSPCSRPIPAFRKWKYWGYTPSYLYNQKKCGICAYYLLPNSINIIDGKYVFENLIKIRDFIY